MSEERSEYVVGVINQLSLDKLEKEPEITIGIQPSIMTYNTLIGVGCDDNGYNHVVLIGNNLTADHDYQVKVGNTVYNKKRTMTENEWQELFTHIAKMAGFAFTGGFVNNE